MTAFPTGIVSDIKRLFCFICAGLRPLCPPREGTAEPGFPSQPGATRHLCRGNVPSRGNVTFRRMYCNVGRCRRRRLSRSSTSVRACKARFAAAAGGVAFPEVMVDTGGQCDANAVAFVDSDI